MNTTDKFDRQIVFRLKYDDAVALSDTLVRKLCLISFFLYYFGVYHTTGNSSESKPMRDKASVDMIQSLDKHICTSAGFGNTK